jgi:hypothetical protein
MISVLSIPRRYADVIARSACELALDDQQRDPLTRHLDRVGMP